MLGIRTQGRRIVGADDPTELWWPTIIQKVKPCQRETA